MCVIGDNKVVVLFDLDMPATVTTVNFSVLGTCQLSECCCSAMFRRSLRTKPNFRLASLGF